MKALYIEDNDDDIVLLTSKIQQSNQWNDFIAVNELIKGIELCVQQKFDIVYIDLNLTKTKGAETIIKFRESIKDVPVIVFSGLDDQKVALRTIQEGAQDYLPKHEINVDVLYKSSQFAIERFKKGMYLEIANSNLRQSEQIAKIGNCTFELTGKAIDFSEGFKKLFNINQDEVIKLDNIGLLFNNEGVQKFQASFQKVCELLEDQEIIIHSSSKGKLRTFRVAFSSNNKSVYLGQVVHVTFFDITFEYEQQKELESRHNRLLKAQKLAKIGSWELNSSTEKFTFSPEALNILEIESKDSFKLDELLNIIEIDDNIIELYHQLNSIGQEVESFPLELSITTPKKNQRILKITAENSPYTTKESTIYTGTVEDVTLRRESSRLRKEFTETIEAQVIERTQQLEDVKKRLENSLLKEKELNELKSQFVSTASHQFRTPLTIIESSAGLISHYLKDLEYPKKDKVNNSINRLHHQIERMIMLMENILVLGKIENNAFELNFSSLDLLDTIQNICFDSNIIRNDNLEIEVIDGLVGDHKVFMDKNILDHIFTNLITNALKYSDKNQNPKVILNSRHHEIVVQIIDFGIGIPEEKLKCLFEPFSRATNVGEIQGSGLGMAIVHQCVQLLNGTIEVQSKLKQGTKVTVTLPKNGKDTDHRG